MSKYAPLGDFLRKQTADLVPLTFAEIERIVGTRLPKSQRYPAWWSNNPFNNMMTQVWLDAGFETEQVDIEGRKLVFRRVARPTGFEESAMQSHYAVQATEDRPAISKHHPLVGWMKGTVVIPPGVDLTEPADPEWADIAWGDQK